MNCKPKNSTTKKCNLESNGFKKELLVNITNKFKRDPKKENQSASQEKQIKFREISTLAH